MIAGRSVSPPHVLPSEFRISVAVHRPLILGRGSPRIGPRPPLSAMPKAARLISAISSVHRGECFSPGGGGLVSCARGCIGLRLRFRGGIDATIGSGGDVAKLRPSRCRLLPDNWTCSSWDHDGQESRLGTTEHQWPGSARNGRSPGRRAMTACGSESSRSDNAPQTAGSDPKPPFSVIGLD